MIFLYLIVMSLMISVLWTRRKFYKFSFQLPGPIVLPFIGVGFKIRNGERLMKFLSECKKKYVSPMVSWLGPHCLLVVSDPESVKTILTSENCVNKSYLYKFLEYAVGTGAFTSNVPVWNQRYKILKPAFHKTILSSYLNIFNIETDNLIDKFQKIINLEESNVYEMFKKFTLEVACRWIRYKDYQETTMGKKLCIQNKEFDEILKAYSGAMEAVSDRMYMPWFHSDFVYENSTMFKKDSKNYLIINSFMEKLIEDKKQQMEKEQETQHRMDKENSSNYNEDGLTKPKDIFIDQIAKYVENGQLTWKDVKDESNVIIAAAFETTSITLYLVFLCIAMHSEYQEKLYQEILDIFPENEFNVSEEDLANMTYTEMIINESMRYIAPVPVVGRVAMNDFQLNKNLTVPKGTQICIDIFNLHRDRSTWGMDAHTFNPDHFLPENVKNRPVYSFVPFTKGLRMCLGYKYAMNLMKMTVAKIFRNFQVSTNVRYEDLVLRGNISMKFKDYPTFTIRNRSP